MIIIWAFLLLLRVTCFDYFPWSSSCQLFPSPVQELLFHWRTDRVVYLIRVYEGKFLFFFSLFNLCFSCYRVVIDNDSCEDATIIQACPTPLPSPTPKKKPSFLFLSVSLGIQSTSKRFHFLCLKYLCYAQIWAGWQCQQAWDSSSSCTGSDRSEPCYH